ncbi:MAG: glycosyltransferase involved in cell wall biosynthesis [Planctomycetota bacterium]|jgi:glycosyltransferase involved in cell wall biosynthesis
MSLSIDYRPALVNREGIGRYVRELVRGMLFCGMDRELNLFAGTLRPSRYSKSELGLIDANVRLLRPRYPTRYFRKLLDKKGIGIDDWIGDTSVYHQTQWSPLPVHHAAEVGTIFDCIYALDAMDSNGPDFLPRDAAQRMLAHSSALAERCKILIVPSQYVADQVVQKLGADPAKVRVTHLGCDHLPPGADRPGHLTPNAPYILTVTRIDRRKNHVAALRIFERLVKKGYPHHWVVVGPLGHGNQEFVHALKESPVRSRVRWLRIVGDGELSTLLKSAELLLWPSLNEGFGLPPLEAMACGTPVVTSHCTSIPEICGDAALLHDPADEDALFESCCKLIEDTAFSQALAEKGLERAAQFTWHRTASETMEIYKELMEPN